MRADDSGSVAGVYFECQADEVVAGSISVQLWR